MDYEVSWGTCSRSSHRVQSDREFGYHRLYRPVLAGKKHPVNYLSLAVKD